jgi:hypothetical protein
MTTAAGVLSLTGVRPWRRANISARVSRAGLELSVQRVWHVSDLNHF